MWSCLKKALPKINKHYDAAVGYLEGNAIYYCVDCVDADIKIGYIHSDYRKIGLSASFDEPFFKQLDCLIGVSEKCSDILRELFPSIQKKIFMIENITSPKVLHKLAEEPVFEYADMYI